MPLPTPPKTLSWPPNPLPAVRQRPDEHARAAGFRRLAGVDEAGRGPWAGPVVACAVILRTGRVAARIDDSKRLTPLQRERAFDALIRCADIGVGIVHADAIDQTNILASSLLAMRHALQELPTPPDLVLVDGAFSPPTALRCWPIVHGDRLSYVVGCASIAAKVIRDRLMRFYHRLFPEYGFDQHKGYGTPAHAVALDWHGPCALHRLSFQPVRVRHAAH